MRAITILVPAAFVLAFVAPFAAIGNAPLAVFTQVWQLSPRGVLFAAIASAGWD